jgi:DNA-binding response OmpR family regulator
MLTARGDDLDIVGGLEAGADDYVVKPVEPRVVDASVQRLRAKIEAGTTQPRYIQTVRGFGYRFGPV